LPSGTTPTGPVAWCGDGAIALTLQGPGRQSVPGVWSGAPPAGPWRLALEDADLRSCTWDGARLLALTDGGLVSVELASGRSSPVAEIAEGYVAQAAFSPDGAWIAYTWTRGDASTVQIVASDGSSPPQTLRDDRLPHALAWSGNGHLLTLRVRGKELDDRWASIVAQYVASPDEVGGERVLASRIGPAAVALSVSRTGNRLVYLTITRQRHLFVGEPGGDGVHSLIADHVPVFAQAWVDDSRLAYSAAPDGDLDVFVRAVGDAVPSKLFGSAVDEYGATPVPDSDEWIFERRVAGSDAVELVWSRPSGDVVVWSGGVADYLARRRSRCVAGPTCFFGVADARGIAISRVTPAGLEPLTHLPAEPWRPIGWDVSPSGDQIASSTSRGLELRRLDGSLVRTIEVDGTLQEVMWGPDGTWIAGTTMGSAGHAYAIVRIDLVDGEVTVIHSDIGWLSHLALSPTALLAWTRTEYDIVAWLAELRP
jgi:hypothetical protein